MHRHSVSLQVGYLLCDKKMSLYVRPYLTPDLLGVYRASFASAGTSSTQLVLPESLKLLPLYTLALIKHIALRSGTLGIIAVIVIRFRTHARFLLGAEIKPDERSYHLALLRTLGVSDCICLLYPRLYHLNAMPAECGTVGEGGKVSFPDCSDCGSFLMAHRMCFLHLRLSCRR